MNYQKDNRIKPQDFTRFSHEKKTTKNGNIHRRGKRKVQPQRTQRKENGNFWTQICVDKQGFAPFDKLKVNSFDCALDKLLRMTEPE